MAAPWTLAETKDQLAHFAEMQRHEGKRAIKELRHDDAKRHADRMESAEDGFLLLGDVESRSPEFMMTHQKLYNACQAHGMVRYDEDIEKTDGDDDEE
jgi:hypothetical protein